tara:strand:+ start:977 stop:1264 length:288 start_codon:yes stop_codon:yes gene_type:complete
MRYNKAKQQRDGTGNRYQETTIIPKMHLSDRDQYIEVSVTDRLDLISNQFYGTPQFWWVIAAANNLGKGTLAIQTGAILRLPANPSTIATGMSGY